MTTRHVIAEDRRMGRWEPHARDRLQSAALDLFLEHGFDRVTVPEITAKAGLTTRTFFRHFVDKREVLFADADQMTTLATRLVLDAPPGARRPARPRADRHRGARVTDARVTAFEGRLEQLKQRKAVIDGHDGIRERELRKLERPVDAIAEAFRSRGVDELTARTTRPSAATLDVQVNRQRWRCARGRPRVDAPRTLPWLAWCEPTRREPLFFVGESGTGEARSGGCAGDLHHGVVSPKPA